MTLKMLRVSHDLTQKEASKKVGVSEGTWSNWEHFKTFPDAEKIRKIEEVFSTKYDEILFFRVNHGLTVKHRSNK